MLIFLVLRRLYIIILVIASVCHGAELAQNVRFKHLTADDGLSQEYVRQIIQDKYGFIWVATNEGLNRYDGHEFVTHLHDPRRPDSLSKDFIYSLLESSDGQLWIGTNGGGLNLLKKDGRTFEHFKSDVGDPTTISGNIVRTIIEDNQGDLWLGTDSGLNRFDLDSKKFERFVTHENKPNTLTSNKIRAIVQQQHGNLWVGTDGGGLNQVDIARKTVRNFRHKARDENSISSDRIRTLFEANDGMLWIGTYDSGLNRYNPRTGFVKRYHTNSGHGLTNNFILNITQDHRGVLWFATDAGLFEYRSESDSFVGYYKDPANPYSLTSDRVTSLFQDEGNVLWVGTLSGINSWNYQTTSFDIFRQSSNKDSGLQSNTVYDFAQSDDDTIWVGTQAGLHKYSEQSRKFTHFGKAQGLIDERITTLAVDKNTLWIGTFAAGLFKMNLQSLAMTHYRPDNSRDNWLQEGGISALSLDIDGNLWVGSFGGGLFRYNKSTDDFSVYSHQADDAGSITSNRVIYALASKNGDVWVSLLGAGVAKLNPKNSRFTRYKHDPLQPNSISSDLIWVMMEDKQGNLWFGSQGSGLDKLSSTERRKTAGAFTHISRIDGLRSNSIFGILEDDKGDLWISSSRGITQLSVQNNAMQHYGPHHGLQSFQFNGGAQLKTKSGKMLFGGNKGFNAFYPSEIQRNQHPPKVALTKIIKINNPLQADVATHTLKSLQLNVSEYLVSFEFAALDFAAVADNQYRYKLDGYDEQWITPDKVHRATYTNLPSGEYTFKVEASNNDGIWAQNGVQLKVSVLPAWYKTRLAYLGYILLFMLFLSLLYLMHLQRLKKQAIYNKQLQISVADKTQVLSKRTRLLQDRIEELNGTNKQLLDDCITDLATGLYNHRFVDDYLNIITKNLERRLEKMTLTKIIDNNRPMFFIIMEVDNLGQLNDTYGCGSDDAVMISLARLVAKQCRHGDVLARWRAGSFLITAEADNTEATLLFAKRLNACVARHAITYHGQRFTVTTSIGICYFPFSITQPNLFNWQQIVTFTQTACQLSRDKCRGGWASIRAGQLGLNRHDGQKILSDPSAMAAQAIIHLQFEADTETDTDELELSSRDVQKVPLTNSSNTK